MATAEGIASFPHRAVRHAFGPLRRAARSVARFGAETLARLVYRKWYLKQLAERAYRALPESYKSLWREAKARQRDDGLIQVLQAFLTGNDLIEQHRFAHVYDPKKVISLIYPYFQKQDTIVRSIESALSQNPTLCGRSDMEIIVVDDGSSDTSVSELLPPEVIYVWRNKFQYGISRSRNLGVKISNGRYLVFLDPDLILNPGYIDAVLRGFARHGDRTVFTGYLYNYHFEGCEDPRAAFGVWENPNVPSCRFLSLAGGNMAISRRLFDEVGGFDEDLIYGEVEDTLFGYLVGQLEGTQVVYSTEMSVRHIPHPVGLAHRAANRSWAVVGRKYPEAYRQFVVEGVR